MRSNSKQQSVPSVCLVGRRIADNENLGLAYLKAALVSAGIPVEVRFLNTPEDLTEITSHVIRKRPLAVGLSISDGGSSILPLALGDMLRRHGFRGHITCGGQFATLARKWLLKRYAWLDSVVRHAGEVPIVQLTRAVAQGMSLSNIPGLTTRKGDGAPSLVLDRIPIETRPMREELPHILRYRAAHILATRGCLGRCGYCSPAALQIEERREGRRAGISNEKLKQCGVGGVRRRSIESICEEMADLYHHRNVRYFYFVDEHLLPYDEQAALQYLDELHGSLKRRGVENIGIGTMLRADRLTPKIATAFADAGLIRAFIGLELGDADDARRFGRKPVGQAELEVIEQLHERGVTTISNMMLVHPYTHERGIQNSLSLLQAVPSGFFEVSRMMIYHGTRLHERILREGRLTGNPIRYGYYMQSDAMERFAAAANRLRIEAFHNYSAAYRAHDMSLHAALGRRLYGKGFGEHAWTRISGTAADLRGIYVDAYRQALDLALKNVSSKEVSLWIADIIDRLAPLNEKLDDAQRAMFENPIIPLHRFNPFRSAAAAGMLTFVIAGAPACVESATSGNADSDSETLSDIGTDSGEGIPTDSNEAATDSIETCDEAAIAEASTQASEQIAETVSCFLGSVVRASAIDPWQGTYTGYTPASQRLVPCNSIDLPASATTSADQAAAAAESISAPCMDSITYLGVTGSDADAQNQNAVDTIVNHCSNAGWGNSYIVELDSSGAVQDVYPDTSSAQPADEETITCIKEALSGLSFPCFADMALCPEMIIVE